MKLTMHTLEGRPRGCPERAVRRAPGDGGRRSRRGAGRALAAVPAWPVALLFAGLWVLGLGGLGGVARAATAVLLEPVLEGPSAQAEAARLRTAAQQALRAQQYNLTPDSDLEVALSGEPQLKSCHTELCRERLGRLLDAQIVARYRIRALAEGKKNSDWHMNVEILDVEVGAFGARLTEDCTDCTAAKAAEKLTDMLMRAILQSAARPRGVLEIHTEPQGASVFVDGTELGITPYKRPAFVGDHKVVLQHVGYRSEQLEVKVNETGRNRTDKTLVAGSDPVKVVVVEKEKTPVYKKWWFWVAIGGAAVAAAAITAGVVVGTGAAGGGERTIPANTYMFTF